MYAFECQLSACIAAANACIGRDVITSYMAKPASDHTCHRLCSSAYVQSLAEQDCIVQMSRAHLAFSNGIDNAKEQKPCKSSM